MSEGLGNAAVPDHHANNPGEIVVAHVAHGDGRRARVQDVLAPTVAARKVLNQRLDARDEDLVKLGPVHVQLHERRSRREV